MVMSVNEEYFALQNNIVIVAAAAVFVITTLRVTDLILEFV
jgi:hypothetical protein